MAKLFHRTIRDLRIAARDGDRAATRVLLRRYGFVELASEVRRGKPIPPRVCTQVAALTAGTGTPDTIHEWEHVEADGRISNDLQDDPASPRRGPALHPVVFED
jgi:hypothetical protein